MYTSPPSTLVAAVRRWAVRGRPRRWLVRVLLAAVLLLAPLLVLVGTGFGVVLLGATPPSVVDAPAPRCAAPPAGPALAPPGSSRLRSPMEPGTYRLTSGFGTRTHPISGRESQHRGQDFAAPAGTPFHAAADGVVTRAGPAGGFGQWLVLSHEIDGQAVDTVYGHMWPDGVGVAEGERVEAGQPIGEVGSNGQSTGPHLHFEVWEGGGRFAGGEAVDPEPLLSEPPPEPPPVPPPPPVVSTAPSAEQLMPGGPQGAQRELVLSTEQLRNAETIVAVGKGRGLPPRAWVIAIATALQESTLINLDYGDRDSVGLFQQRTSQGWGAVEQIMEPEYAAGKFYEVLENKVVDAIPDWERRPLTEVAQIVQRSGFPDAYAKWETVAADAVREVHGAEPVGDRRGPEVEPSCESV